MLNIIKSDFYRIFRGKAVYVSLIIAIASILLSTFQLTPGWVGVNNSMIDSYYNSNMDEMSNEEEGLYVEATSILEERKILKKYPYELDRAIVGANANFYYVFVVMIVIVLSTDFANSTVKNTISSAISRRKYYLSKLVSSLLFCTLFILLSNYGTYIINLIMNGSKFSSGLGTITKITLYQLPLMYGIISLLVCISVSVRKTSMFNTIAIPLLVAFQLILIGAVNLFKLNPNIALYEYQVALCRLAGANISGTYILKCVFLGIGGIIVFNLTGYYLFKKAEIK